jgi:hypothetical protein
MLSPILVCAIAGCSVTALVGSPKSPHPRGGDVVSAAGRLETLCAWVNPSLLKVAVALAVLVAVLSSDQGSRWGDALVAHPEWFGPASDPEGSISVSPSDLATVTS